MADVWLAGSSVVHAGSASTISTASAEARICRMGRERSDPYTPAVLASVIRPVLLGIVAGFVSGMFGVGGGVIVVPGLVVWMALDQRTASGTSTATIVASAAAAAVLFGAEGAVDWAAAAWIFVGAGVGAVVGARSLGRIPEKLLSRGFAITVLAAAVRLYL